VSAFEKINSAIVDIRDVNGALIRNSDVCFKEGSPCYKKGVNERYAARDQLIKAGDAERFIFGFDVTSRVTAYVQFDKKNEDICSPEMPNDAVYLEKQKELMDEKNAHRRK
jgi:hypothetical protein